MCRVTLLGSLLILFSIQSCFVQTEENITRSITFNEDIVPRVVNGIEADLTSVPYQLAFKAPSGPIRRGRKVSIPIGRRKRNYYTFCGGVLITPITIMSAAHCFKNRGSTCFSSEKIRPKTFRETYAVAGNLQNKGQFRGENENGQWRRIKDMFKPKKYKFPKDDICIGHVKRKFIINDHVAPIPYATVHEDYKGQCLVSGFGRISKTANSEILRMAQLDLLTMSECTSRAGMRMNKFICTDTVLADSGKGDSGGPLVCTNTKDPDEGPKGILVGIVSGGSRRYSFFTRVTSHTKFIKSGVIMKFSDNNIMIVWLCAVTYFFINLNRNF